MHSLRSVPSVNSLVRLSYRHLRLSYRHLLWIGGSNIIDHYQTTCLRVQDGECTLTYDMLFPFLSETQF
jgi:hypothetical protein